MLLMRTATTDADHSADVRARQTHDVGDDERPRRLQTLGGSSIALSSCTSRLLYEGDKTSYLASGHDQTPPHVCGILPLLDAKTDGCNIGGRSPDDCIVVGSNPIMGSGSPTRLSKSPIGVTRSWNNSSPKKLPQTPPLLRRTSRR